MLISIAGSQGSGKSTVLKELGAEGYNIVNRKTARSIIDEWGVTLNAINEDFELKQAFQMELVDRKFKDEIELAYSDELFFTERTFADLFTYALIAFGQYNRYDDWIDTYYKTCKDACNNYTQVYYLSSCFSNDIEEDGVRSINQHYSRMVDSVMGGITREMIPEEKLSIITNNDIDVRIAHILTGIEAP